MDLEALYQRWHDPQYLGTDPLVLVREAPAADREVVAFLMSCLAVGRASHIVKAGRDLLSRLGSPLDLGGTTALSGFQYRFFSQGRVEALVGAVGRVVDRHGSLEGAWRSTGAQGWEALEAFAALFRSPGEDLGILVPVEGSGGAHKRLNLFLRWMVRQDALDPGGWTALRPADLFMPVDTHVLQWARAEGLTQRKLADRRACLEITEALRTVCPDDPLRYDFAITRAGMESKGTLF